MSDDPFAPVNSDTRTRRVGGVELENVVPVPAGIAAAPTSHPKLGKPTHIWTYHDAAGGVLGHIHRYPVLGSKTYRSVTLWRPAAGGKPEWRWKSWPPPRPLYGLQRLAERPSALVVVVEGEKAADACQRLLPGVVAVSAPNGAGSAHKADWSPLKGRQVTIWPDADDPGREYGRTVAELIRKAGAASVSVLSPPVGVKDGWDAADALAEGWDEARAVELIATAALCDSESTPRGRKRRQRDDLIGDVVSTPGVELWHDASGEGYVTVPMNGHLENYRVRSTACDWWLSGVYYQKHGKGLGGQTLEDVKRTLQVKARMEGPEHQPFVRVGQLNGKLYLDLCDEEWRVTEITRHGWDVIRRSPVKFLRAESARPIPEPEQGGMIEELRRFVPVQTEDEFRLIVAWLVAALRPGFPFAILIVNGAHGSGKSVLCRALRLLIDPDQVSLASPPKDERDLFLAAFNTGVCAYDNLSEVKGFLPDALCRVASGGGLRTRTLHTNYNESVIVAQRPILLNGIPTLTEQPDVGRRAIVINLPKLTKIEAEADYWSDFERVRARILGALLDMASRGLRDVHTVTLDQSGTMADFEKWSRATAPAGGWTASEFQAAYLRNQNAVNEDTFQADTFMIELSKYAANHHPQGWEDAPAAMQFQLDNAVPEHVRKSRSWPKSPGAFGDRVRRAIPVLEQKGFTIERRHSGTRTIKIVPPRSAGAQPGVSPQPSGQ